MTDYEDHRLFIRGAVDVEEAGPEALPGVRTERARTGVNTAGRSRGGGPDGRALSDWQGAGPLGGHGDLPVTHTGPHPHTSSLARWQAWCLNKSYHLLWRVE